MIKVFLVEDEFIVRQGIKKNVPWEEHGYEFCGEAADGELAFPMIQKEKPDIVITDIRMPFMDGLELSRLIKETLPETEIIVLTGHEEFEYAKEGIRLGIAKYLSKPINGQQLVKEIDDVAEKIRERKEALSHAQMYKKEMEEDLKEKQRDFFTFLVTEGRSVTEIWEEAKKMQIDLTAMWYNVGLLGAKVKNRTQEEYSKRIVEIEKNLANLSKEQGVLFFDRKTEGYGLIFKGDSQEEILAKQEAYFQKAREIFEGTQDILYYGGLGNLVNRITELPKAFESAGRAYANRFFVQESRIFYANEELPAKVDETENFSVENVDPKQLDRRRILNFLRVGEQEELLYFVEEFFKNLDHSAMESTLFRQYIVMDIYFSVTEFVQELSQEKAGIRSFDVAKDTLSKEATIRYMMEIMTEAIRLREQAASDKYGDVVDEIKRYIQANYGKEELSLNEMASYVNFSPNHLSMVFSQETGETLIKYLTNYRMERAKEILRCSGKKSSEVAQEVGYKDPHYFSYLFKKTQGMTPTQYRAGNSAN